MHGDTDLQFGDPDSLQLKMKAPITFGAVDRMVSDDVSIMGLPARAVDKQASSVFHELVRQGLLDAPIFTTYLSKCSEEEECWEGGQLSLGTEDPAHCGPVHKWVPVVENEAHWTVRMSGVKVNDQFVPVNVNGISDTGTSVMLLPSAVVNHFLFKLGVSAMELLCYSGV